MSRGFGSTYLRGSTWWISYYRNGEEARETSGSKKERDALALLKQRHLEISQGVDTSRARKLTFDDLAELLTQDYRNKANKSIATVLYSLKNLRAYFYGSTPALEIPPRVDRYIATRQEAGKKAATIRYELALLKRMFMLAYERRIIPALPYIPSVLVRNTRTGFFEEDDFRKVLGELPPSLQAVARFAYLTGWRKNEILSLTWGQVDFKAGVVRLEVGTTKNDDGRTFPFSTYPALKQLLEEQAARTQELGKATSRIIPWVFHRNGKPIEGFRRAWTAACTRAGVLRLFHDLRRSAARNMLRGGIPQQQIMKLMGHTTDAMFRRYAMVSEADLAEAVKRMAR